MKLTRHQLYVLASFATFAQNTTMVIKDDSQKENGDFEVAWKPKKGDKQSKKVRKNGYVYYTIHGDGNMTLIPETKGKKKR